MEGLFLVKCKESNDHSAFVPGVEYEARKGVFGDIQVRAYSGYNYNLNKDLTHVSSHGTFFFEAKVHEA